MGDMKKRRALAITLALTVIVLLRTTAWPMHGCVSHLGHEGAEAVESCVGGVARAEGAFGLRPSMVSGVLDLSVAATLVPNALVGGIGRHAERPALVCCMKGSRTTGCDEWLVAYRRRDVIGHSIGYTGDVARGTVYLHDPDPTWTYLEAATERCTKLL
jgi:hypothetical protein